MSTRFVFVLFAIFISLRGNAQVPLQPNMVPYYSFKTKLWGVSDTNGKIIIPIIYHELKLPYSTLAVCLKPQPVTGVRHTPSPPAEIYKSDGTFVMAGAIFEQHEGFAVVANDRKYGLIDTLGNIMISLTYDNLSSVSEGKVICKSGKTNYVVDVSGKIIASSDTCEFSLFSGGRAWVRGAKGRIGSMDSNGKITWHQTSYPVTRFEGRVAIVSKKPGDYTGVIDYSGKLIVPIRYVNIQPVKYMIFVELNGKKGVYNLSGKMLAEAECERIELVRCNVSDDQGFVRGWSYHSDKYLVVSKNSSMGVVDTNGNIIVPFDYKYVKCMNEGIFTVYASPSPGVSKMGFIDSTGRQVTPAIYDAVTSFRYGAAFVKEGTGYRMLDRSGRFVNNELYDSPGKPNSGDFDSLFIIEKDRKRGVINCKGEVVIPFAYDFIWRHGDRFTVGQGNLYGTMTIDGKEILPVKFTWIGCYHDGYSWAKTDSGFVVVDSVGNIKPLAAGCNVNTTSIYSEFCPSGLIKAKCGTRSVWMNTKGDSVAALQAYRGALPIFGYIIVYGDSTYGTVDNNYNVLLPLAKRSIVNRRTATIFNVYVGKEYKGQSVFENINGTKYYDE